MRGTQGQLVSPVSFRLDCWTQEKKSIDGSAAKVLMFTKGFDLKFKESQKALWSFYICKSWGRSFMDMGGTSN